MKNQAAEPQRIMKRTGVSALLSFPYFTTISVNGQT